MKHRIICGDVRDVLRTQAANSFDACLTDPPYGLEFMGKAWDGVVPGVEVWRDVLRVLKPGAPLLVFGGTRTFHRLACAIEDAGFLLSDTLCWLHGQGFPKGHSQLKPAWEPITLAWKKGPRVLAIDAARIGGKPWKAHDATGLAATKFFTDGALPVIHKQPHNLGRWPANVLLDEEAAAALDEQTGKLTSGANPERRHSPKTRNSYGEFPGQAECTAHRGTDTGGASRFFYCAKASRSERGEGNTHPTVKPVKLTEYLARLILPAERDTPRRILIPFMGSGSEAIGARKAGWDFALGIDSNQQYAAIATNRLAATA